MCGTPKGALVCLLEPRGRRSIRHEARRHPLRLSSTASHWWLRLAALLSRPPRRAGRPVLATICEGMCEFGLGRYLVAACAPNDCQADTRTKYRLEEASRVLYQLIRSCRLVDWRRLVEYSTSLIRSSRTLLASSLQTTRRLECIRQDLTGGRRGWNGKWFCIKT